MTTKSVLPLELDRVDTEMEEELALLSPATATPGKDSRMIESIDSYQPRNDNRLDSSWVPCIKRPILRKKLAWFILVLLSVLCFVLLSAANDNKSDTKELARTTTIEAPIARRDDNRFIYAGISPPGWNPKVPRQALDSKEPMLDPPVPIADPYGWLRDETRSKLEVLNYLQKENNYTNEMTGHLEALIETVYQEMKSTLQETSHTFPYLAKDYYYYRRTIQNVSYPLHCRAPKPQSKNEHGSTINNLSDYLKEHLSNWDGSTSMPILPNEEIYLDENELAQKSDYFEIGSIEISPSQNFVAFTVDKSGNEQYQLIILQLDNKNVVYHNESLFISGEILWGNNDDILYYTVTDDSQRTYQVYRKNLNLSLDEDPSGTDVASNFDELLYEELDVLFWVGLAKTTDKKYLLVISESSESSEFYYLDLTVPAGNLKVIAYRRDNVLYEADHLKGSWWLLSNYDNSPNFQLWKSPVGGENDWVRVTDPTSGKAILDGIPLEEMTTFENYVVIGGREKGIQEVWILQLDKDMEVTSCKKLAWDVEPAHAVSLAPNPEFHASTAIIRYQSLITPLQYIQIDLNEPDDKNRWVVLMETVVPGYQRSRYACDRKHVQSRDGQTDIPVSIVYLRSTLEKAKKRGYSVPLHLYAYGAYGVNIEPTFHSTFLPLLDRGIIYAIAHVRGGGEMGRMWYEDGKFLNKLHTFEDFIDVARYFVESEQWTTPDKMSCEGRSAGGLTIGASLNMSPELFRFAILGVPFVDVVATMVDASISLTSGEWLEWGNPNEKKFFNYMMSYSPVNNVQSGKKYPSCLLLAGLHDPRVQYWEPAKLAASMRYSSANNYDQPICLKTDMTSGHFSASDRYKYLRELAFDYSFLLWQLGVESP